MLVYISYLILFSIALNNGFTVEACKATPSLTPGQTYKPSFGCPYGENYRTGGLNCVCYSYCGYICPAPTTTTTTTTTTTPSTTTTAASEPRCSPFPVPPGKSWIRSFGCRFGTSITTDSSRCDCCNNVGYLCSPQPPPTQCPPTSLTAGQKYIPSNGCPFGSSYRGTSNEICKCCSNVGYLCQS